MVQDHNSEGGADVLMSGSQGPSSRIPPEVAQSWLKALGVSEAALQDFAVRVSTVLRAINKGLRDTLEAAHRAHQRSAESALNYQRTRIQAWKPADIQRILELNAAVAPNA